MFKWLFLLVLIPSALKAQLNDVASIYPSTASRRLIHSEIVHADASLYFSVKPKIGFLAAHRGVMSHLPKETILGTEISLAKRLGAEKEWHARYAHPYIGVTLYGSTVGNNAILGQAFGSYAFIEFPFNKGKRHQVTGKLGCGLGYVTKVFDQEKNVKNVAISTHLNALICLAVQGHIDLTERHQLIYSIDLTHLSNGSSKVPNLGLNMPNFGLGYAYRIKNEPSSVKLIEPLRQPFFSGWKFHLLGVLSAKEIFPTSGQKYPIYAVSIMGRKLFRPKVGMEISYDLMSKQSVFDYKGYVPKTQWSIFQMGVYAGYVLPLDHLQIVLGMGAYVKDRYEPDGPLYHRVGMRYQFDNGITANLVLKSHWAKADYIEYGIGYTFNYQKK
ncbi:MAG TPA: acyloxyacyl hydrolase [Fluviicola sp.]|nr:acyloxyacyl hydrolase [Fluviicola sp.]